MLATLLYSTFDQVQAWVLRASPCTVADACVVAVLGFTGSMATASMGVLQGVVRG